MSQIEIPKGWSIHSLEEICDIKAGFAEGKKDIVNGTIHLRMNNIDTEFRLNFDLIRTINPTKEQIEKYKLQKDDIIFNNTNSTALVGKSAFFNIDKVCLYSNHLTRLRVNNIIILPKWLLLYLQYLWHQRYFEKNCNKWVNQSAFNNEKIKNLQIPLPPLESQKKIVQKLDYILGQLEEKKKEIFNIIEKNNFSIVFLEKNWLSFTISHEIENHENRKRWKVLPLKELTSSIGDGIHSTPNYVEHSDFYFINGNNLKNGAITITEKTKMIDEKEYQKYMLDLSEKTILISINGTIGNLAFYKGEKVILGKSACYINCNDELNPEFLYYLLQSNTIKNYFNNELTRTSIYNLSLASVRKTPIPLPSILEQKKIVKNLKNIQEELEHQQSQFQVIKQNYDKSLKYVNQIQSSVLNAAFTGKLVN